MKQSDDELLAKLDSFLRRELGTKVARIGPQTDLARDLGVDGSDGADLMRRYGEDFHVDMSAFRVRDYFGPEASFNPFSLLFPSWWRRRQALRSLIVQDLVRAALLGRWSRQGGDS